jgi:hypothetical protein
LSVPLSVCGGLALLGRGRCGRRLALIELDDPLLEHQLVFFEAPDFLVDLELGGDPVVDLCEGPLLLAQLLARAVRFVALRRAGQQQAHAQRCEPVGAAADQKPVGARGHGMQVARCRPVLTALLGLLRARRRLYAPLAVGTLTAEPARRGLGAGSAVISAGDTAVLSPTGG